MPVYHDHMIGLRIKLKKTRVSTIDVFVDYFLFGSFDHVKRLEPPMIEKLQCTWIDRFVVKQFADFQWWSLLYFEHSELSS